MVDHKDEIKAKIDIVELVGEYVRLTSAGTYFKTRCPFHQEKTPSFTVSSTKQIWHCFGCNEGGDVFSFVMKQEGVSFPEALKILAQKAGVALTYQDPAQLTHKNKLLDLTELAAGFFHQALIRSAQGEVAREYLKKRGIDQYTIDEFSLGYALPEPDRLASFLIARKYDAQEIVLAGLGIQKDQGYGLIDRFRARLMIPIKNVHGQVVGFTGRVLDDHLQVAKYINSPQSDLYDKSRVVFGLDVAKAHIRTSDSTVLVEGNMDFLASYQSGVKNIVATSGTALTSDQIRLIKRFSQNLLFCFDTDSAGIQATTRGIEIALREGMNVKVVQLPKDEKGDPLYKDPDECVMKDLDAWKNSIATAIPFVAHIIDLHLKAGEVVDAFEKKKRIRKVLEVILWLPDPIERTIWIKELSAISGVNEEILSRAMHEIGNSNSEQTKYSDKKAPSVPIKPPQKNPISTQKEEHLLALLVKFPQFAVLVPANRYEGMWTSEDRRELYGILQKRYNKADNSDSAPDSPETGCVDEKIEAKMAFLELLAEREFGEMDEKAAEQTIRELSEVLRKDRISVRLRELERQMKEAESQGDLEAQKRYAEEFYQLYQA